MVLIGFLGGTELEDLLVWAPVRLCVPHLIQLKTCRFGWGASQESPETLYVSWVGVG